MFGCLFFWGGGGEDKNFQGMYAALTTYIRSFEYTSTPRGIPKKTISPLLRSPRFQSNFWMPLFFGRWEEELSGRVCSPDNVHSKLRIYVDPSWHPTKKYISSLLRPAGWSEHTKCRWQAEHTKCRWHGSSLPKQPEQIRDPWAKKTNRANRKSTKQTKCRWQAKHTKCRWHGSSLPEQVSDPGQKTTRAKRKSTNQAHEMSLAGKPSTRNVAGRVPPSNCR